MSGKMKHAAGDGGHASAGAGGNAAKKALTSRGGLRMGIHFLEMLFGITVLSAGAAMGIIAGLGQTTSTGTCSAIAAALSIKVGTAMILLYSLFLVFQLLMLGRSFGIERLAQLLPVALQGWILNYFRYDFPPFQALAPESYGARFVVFLIGMALISLGFTAVRCSQFVNYPPESFCVLVAERLGIRFGTCKIGLDFVYVATSVIVCLAAGTTMDMVREGTLIFAVCNGMLINLFLPRVEKVFRMMEAWE